MNKRYIKLIPLILYPYMWFILSMILVYVPWGSGGTIAECKICSFLFCIDVVVAIFMYMTARKHEAASS